MDCLNASAFSFFCFATASCLLASFFSCFLTFFVIFFASFFIFFASFFFAPIPQEGTAPGMFARSNSGISFLFVSISGFGILPETNVSSLPCGVSVKKFLKHSLRSSGECGKSGKSGSKALN